MIRKIVGFMFICCASIGFFIACDGFEDVACNDDAECLSDEYCVEQSCVPTCDIEDEDACLAGEECVEHEDADDPVCVEADEGEDCTTDTDCDGDEICYSGDVCVEPCDSTDDCGEGEVCRERDDSDNDDSTVCLGPPDECSANEDCPDGWVCDEDESECVDPDTNQEFYTVLIEDITDDPDQGDPDRCDDTTFGYRTSGAVITAVTLLDASDQSEIAHASYADLDRGDYTGDAEEWLGFPDEIFDGEAPDHEAACPSYESRTELPHGDPDSNDVTTNFHDDNVLPLGCGGQLFLQFFDEDDEMIELTEDHQIEVRTYGVFCSEEWGDAYWGDDFSDCEDPEPGTYCAQGQDDPYIADMCTDRSDAGIDVNTCVAPLNDGDPASGTQFFDVQLL